MLETPKERVVLLRAGLTGKMIEELYLISNNFKIVRSPMQLSIVEINMAAHHNAIISQETTAECL